MLLLLQAAGAVPTSAKDLILHSSTATQVVLGILIVLSLLSWAIMLGVGREITRSLRGATTFAREVERSMRVDEVAVTARLAAPNAAQRTLVRAIQFVGDGRTAMGAGDSHAVSRVET